MQTSQLTKSDIEISKEYEHYQPEFIIPGLVKRYGINILAAERGTGKTRLALWIAYAIVYGYEETLGYKIKLNGDVLFANMEIPEKELKAFFEPIKSYFENTLGLTAKHSLKVISFKGTNATLQSIAVAAEEGKPLLTIIDNYKLYQYQILKEDKTLKEITNANFGVVLKTLTDLIQLYNTSILLINHTNKGTKYSASSGDLMYGPGALPDFADQITLMRKTVEANQRIIVPDKARYSAEGLVTTNLIKIKSADDASPNPEWLKFELEEEDVDELDYLPSQAGTKRISEKEKKEIIEYMTANKGTLSQCAEEILGDANRKSAVWKIMDKHKKR